MIGHIKVYSTVLDKKNLTPDDAQRLDLLVQLLNYALSKHAIAEHYFSLHNTKVVNISMSGLLFEIQDTNVFNYLLDHDRLKICIPIKSHELEMRAEITRLLPGNNGYRIGVMFFQGAPDDFHVLEGFIHERIRAMLR